VQLDAFWVPGIKDRKAGEMPLSNAHQVEVDGAMRQTDDAERYRLLFEFADDAIFCSDLNGTIVDANPAAERLTGYERSELIGQSARERIVAPEWQEVTRARLKRRLEELTPYQRYEVVLLDRSGVRKPVEAASTLVYKNGQPAGIASIVRDVSERRRAETVLAESEERFRQAFEHAPIGMAVCAPSGQWLQVNNALCELAGYTAEELLTMTFQDITHPDDLDLDLDYIRRLYNGEITSYQMEKRYIRKDGTIIWILLTRAVVHDAHGTPVYALGQMQDITERKHAEHTQEELRTCHASDKPLTSREREVLTLTAHGHTSQRIATQLAIGTETVQTHIRRAMRKLNANNRTHAVATAIRLNLI
jgi:PAS domain S-box-containing protein